MDRVGSRLAVEVTSGFGSGSVRVTVRDKDRARVMGVTGNFRFRVRDKYRARVMEVTGNFRGQGYD